jgi:tetratricopeptide (TPR) repeat protein
MNRMIYRGGKGEQGMIPGGPLGEARYALASGQNEKAERISRKRLERNPNDVSARVVLAQALLQQHQIDAAAQEARRAIADQPTNVDAHLVLSAALLQRSGPLGRTPPEAERAARRAVQLQPKAAKTHVQLAEVLAAKRDMSGARAEADEAVRLEPRLAGAHLMRAVILLSDKDPQGALQASDAALRNDRSLTQADLVKANAYVDLKQYDDALRAVDTVDRQAPMLGGPATDALRGRIYFKQRKFGTSYGKFLQLQRSNPRLRWLAPVLAGLTMVMVGQFGQDAQIALPVFLIIVAALVLFGLHFIPVVGGWIVAVALLGIFAVFAFGAVRQRMGRLLPSQMTGRVAAIGGGIAAGLAGFALGLLAISALARAVFKVHDWFGPPVLLLAGIIALVFAAGALYLMGRFGGGAQSAA